MSIFTKRLAPMARQGKREHIYLPSRVITTNDFGFCLPIFAREVIPGDQWHLDISSFLRLSPLSVPTYASIRQTVRAFYVRFSSVWLPWNDFYAGRPYVNNGVSYNFDTVPQIENSQIVDFFAKNSTEVTSGTSDFEAIVRVSQNDEVIKQFRFKDDYRRMYSLLLNLGYKINWVIWSPNNQYVSDNTSFSLLPILCYLRAYYDYYLPSRYTNTSSLRQIFDKVSYDAEDLQKILGYVRDTLYCNFDSDYFTASWLNPNSPLTQSSSQYIFKDVSISNSFVAPSNLQTPELNTGLKSQRISVLSQDSLNLLNAAYNWVVRQGLAGQRYFEQIFAQYGIKLPNILTRRCEFLGSTTSSVMTQDVTSTASTQVGDTVTALGDYAGKGHAASQGSNIKLDANDYGMIICIHNIIPDGGYVQGRNREVMHLSRYDYFQPEFDCVGMQAVRNDELFAMGDSGAEITSEHQPNGVFGFLPRYSEYRRPYDNLSGDFVIASRNTGLNSYHSFRIFDPTELSQSFPSNDLSFRQISPNKEKELPFSRIFNLTDDSYDHFICVFNIDAKVFRYMRTFQTSYLENLDGNNVVSLDPDCQLH